MSTTGVRASSRRNSATAASTSRRLSEQDPRSLAHRVHVLVAAPGEVHEEDLVAAHRWRDLHGVGERMARFERGNDALEAAQRMEGGERLIVGHRDVLRAPGIL